ncbi:hypothetical protein DPMN_134037 [Dreissena polymorpha]|uniref:Uncharacterized protein n=1 Tax=Dreissena polymorpha TaxID=45954 RepID=A0A9D4IVZ7_DREPO|nr:hypothetical protein DPMN_164301 [Dreissena polymorpha]KAH3805730.1 hypothetical protein DPMN_134037 [Dreissena polymorpha]
MKTLNLPFRFRSHEHEDPERDSLVDVPVLDSGCDNQTPDKQHVGVLKQHGVITRVVL